MEKPGTKYHRERLGEALREEIETIVEGELGDPRIGLVNVSDCSWRQDSRSAQVYCHARRRRRRRRPVGLEGLTAAAEFIRHEVAENLHLRRPPELYFSSRPLGPISVTNRRVTGTDKKEEEKRRHQCQQSDDDD